MMVENIVVICMKCGVDISAANSSNITGAASHATCAVIVHTATTTTNNNNVGYIYNCNRVIVTSSILLHENVYTS